VYGRFSLFEATTQQLRKNEVGRGLSGGRGKKLFFLARLCESG
jgi:hypothetical protein